MDYKKTKAPKTTITRDLNKLTEKVGNVYETVAIIGKRSNQIASSLKKELDTVSHRPFCTGFYFGDPEQLIPDTAGYVRDWLFVATAIEDSKNGSLKIETRNPFAVGDTLEFLSPGRTGVPFPVSSIVNEDGEPLDRSATPMRILTISAPDSVRAGDILRKRI